MTATPATCPGHPTSVDEIDFFDAATRGRRWRPAADAATPTVV